ncbi:MAG TPA: heparan-alpha-glucosaminide N-acetyltransferase domain-containing protein [Gemmatimonadaceae bacterium]|nr:heparan-alpha-glucosaminide N-acetyltransferase domain-containing protein [Gemmatimonadaceae bacterium]
MDTLAHPAPAAIGFAEPVRRRAANLGQSAQRLESVDLYRGILMVIMLIDHVRYFVHFDGATALHDPLDVATTTWYFYLTRWITHLCAPGFVLLAGASAGFQRQRGASVPALSRFLWTRGLALIVMELVFVRVFSSFNVDLHFFGNLQVIWAIGVSMVALAAFVHLPDRAILGVGLLLVCGHNALDGVKVPVWRGPADPTPSISDKLWMLLHQGGFFPLYGADGPVVRAHYPLLPWIGLIAVGYVFANLWTMDAARRRRVLRQLSAAMAVAFVALRLTNVYGDNIPWHSQDTLARTVGSFMNLQKYPPSLLFMLATLAPTLVALSFLDGRRLRARLARAFITYGRVPMFYYLLQWLWAFACGIVVTSAAGLPISGYFAPRASTFFGAAPTFGGSLTQVYLCWLAGAVVLYFPCRWYAGVKARRKDLVLLRYL